MNNQIPPNQPSQNKRVVQEKRARRGVSFLNVLSILAVVVIIALFVWLEKDRRSTEQELRQASAELEEIRNNSQVTGEELSQQVLEKVRVHMEISMDPEPTVATIVDVDALKEANEFYASAKNGDHLIITARRAILYDPDRDMILDVVPVVIDQEEQSQQSAEESSEEPDEGDVQDDSEADAENAASPGF